MTLKRNHEFVPGLVDQTLWAAKQLIAENIALGKDPIDWVCFFAEIGEEYGEI